MIYTYRDNCNLITMLKFHFDVVLILTNHLISIGFNRLRFPWIVEAFSHWMPLHRQSAS
jgi:hypothetical protein